MSDPITPKSVDADRATRQARFVEADEVIDVSQTDAVAVSYTHLTLPTSDLV